jgi:excisionase family DNA binding protein
MAANGKELLLAGITDGSQVEYGDQPVLALRSRGAAKALGISPRLLWQLTHDGKIPCVRVGTGEGRTILYPVAELQAWLSQQVIAGRRCAGDSVD